MTERLFTLKEQARLQCNPNVQAVSDKSITYTDEFKRHFISENEKGKLPRDIFEEAGLNADLIGLMKGRSLDTVTSVN
ncbi:HTH domain-containing protein [Sporosarcina sp. P29]|uniref:HTH domain-containing protein n=1 Tax=Sporosarcina sp. P29 TaxID=2048252 RepID=UPI001E2AF008|nr:HTH domain-containing protein [Sporosarcina sp. P29]